MKVAVISDIHGNLYALDRVLAQIDREGADRIVCLGDVVAFGPQPVEVLGRVRSLGCPVVMGNCDAFFVEWPLPFEDNLNYARVAWAAEMLSPEDRAFMGGFQPTVTIGMGDRRLLCFHGSPRSNTEIILSTTPDDELDAMLAGYDADVMIGGHTHAQMVRLSSGCLVVNAGSVGMPYEPPSRDTHPPRAEWAMVEASADGLSVSLRHTPLEVEAMIASARSSDMPGLDRWVASRANSAQAEGAP